MTYMSYNHGNATSSKFVFGLIEDVKGVGGSRVMTYEECDGNFLHVQSKCSDSDRSMEVKLPALMTDRKTNRPTDVRKDGLIWKFHKQKRFQTMENH